MVQTSITPGPWIVREHKNPKYLDLPTFDVLAPNEDAGKVGVSYSGEHLSVATGLDSQADARLIAVAPAMLAALESFVDLCAGRDLFPNLVEEARSIIASV